MKKLILLAAIAAMPFFASAQDLKFGYVNSGELLEAMPEIADYEKQIADYNAKNVDYLQGLENELRDKQAKFEEMMSDTSGKFTDKMKADAQEDLQVLYARYQRSAQDINRDTQQQQMKLLQPIQDRLMQTIETVGKKNNFFMILDSQAILYKSEKAVDATSLVKKELGIK